MFNPLIDHFPTEYRGFKINTSFRAALEAIEILDDPSYDKNDEQQSEAAHLAALDCIFVDKDIFSASKLGLEGAIKGLYWWISCAKTDKVERMWKKWRFAPDVDDVKFTWELWNKKDDDKIVVKENNGDNTFTTEEVDKVCVYRFIAPDGTIRYYRKWNGTAPAYDFYEDRELIYSGFYKVFNIDLDTAELHWFKFNMLFIELLHTEGTMLNSEAVVRSFDASNYDRKTQKDYIRKREKDKSEHKLLGILPYIKKQEG